MKQPAVNNEYVDAVIEAITTVAQKDGDKGRGKIFIFPIEECIRVRTGERGSVSIG
ncbi:MAG: P-II family nitrogen regulator [Candidatus Marinimicrobia bacterium]|nr:P-II family nitrogen regulator [Candidatus Neomarinimicrobiota bacterium]